MLVEHVFVTTKEAPETLAAARDFLVLGGFRVTVESENLLELARGCKTPAKAKGILDLPQQVRVEFDRGRVSVAVLTQEARKASPMHRDLLLGIAQSLECRLARGLSDEEARQAWSAAEAVIAADLARRRRRTLYFVIIVCTILFTCVGWLVGLGLKVW